MASPELSRGEGPPSLTSWNIHANAAQDTISLLFKVVPTRTPRSLPARLLSSWVALSIRWCLGLFLPRSRTLHSPVVKFIRFLSAHFSVPLRTPWIVAQPSGVSATPPSFTSSPNLLRVRSAPSSRSLMKMLNRTGPRFDNYALHPSPPLPELLASNLTSLDPSPRSGSAI